MFRFEKRIVIIDEKILLILLPIDIETSEEFDITDAEWSKAPEKISKLV